jgi:ParB family chromosome partitioning protein
LQNALFQKAVSEDWSVRRLEDAVRQSGNMDIPSSSSAATKVSAQELQAWQSTLKSFFKTPVALKINEKGEGEIKLSFKTKEELLTILNKVQ